VLSKFLRGRHLHEESLARWEERTANNRPVLNRSEENREVVKKVSNEGP
jgi:hypothetical protein